MVGNSGDTNSLGSSIFLSLLLDELRDGGLDVEPVTHKISGWL